MPRFLLRAVAALLLFSTLPALAETAPPAPPTPAKPYDQRLAAPTIAALNAMLVLREAELRAAVEDGDVAVATAKAARNRDWDAAWKAWMPPATSAAVPAPESPAP